MAFVAAPVVMAGASAASAVVGAAALAAANHKKNNLPLVKAEKDALSKNHQLEVAQARIKDLLPLVNDHFATDSTIELCFQALTFSGFSYKHWFVKCGAWIIEFGSGAGLEGEVWHNTVDVHCNSRSTYDVKKSYTITPAVVERIQRVVGATSYSLLFRNCEHVANYIVEGRWTSMQTFPEGAIGKRLLELVADQEILSLRNALPKELEPPSPAASGPMYAGRNPRVEYSERPQKLNVNDKDAYNVVILGPTGAGKSTLVNLMFNQRVAVAANEVDSVNMTFYTGTANVACGGRNRIMNKRINVIDSIGFCDSHLKKDEVHRIIQEKITANAVTLHKVVIVTSGEIQQPHQESIKEIMSWLKYNPNGLVEDPSMSFVFVCTKADGKTDDEKAQVVMRVCDALGASTFERNFAQGEGREFVEHALAVGLDPTAPFDQIQEDYEKVMRLVFDVPTEPVQVSGSSRSSAVLAKDADAILSPRARAAAGARAAATKAAGARAAATKAAAEVREKLR